MGRNIHIFLIYTRENNDVMLHFLRHLKLLEEDFDLTIWHDDPIDPAQIWKPQNESHIHKTDIFLLLVSDAFMRSEFIRQLEFKMVIDRYKEEKSVVIPVIVDQCQWEIDFKSDDYDFNLNELMVLPEDGRPLKSWNSQEQAHKHVTDYVRKVIAAYTEEPDQEESDMDLEKKATIGNSEDQLAIHFSEEEMANRKAEEEKKHKQEAEAKRRAEEEKRRKEAAEAKRRAEEEKKNKQEAEAKRRAGEEKRRKEEAEAKQRAEEEKRQKEEAEARQRAAEEKRQQEEAKFKNRVKEEKADGDERITGSNAVDELRLQHTPEAIGSVEEPQQPYNRNIKKRVLAGSLIALVAIVAVWSYSVLSSDSEQQSPAVQKTKAIVAKDSVTSETSKKDSPEKAETLSELSIGDTFEGGIIFAIDEAGKTGKIAHPEDAGVMPWQKAIKINKELGEGWRLPTFDELQIMYRTIGQGATNNGHFANELYWSATAYDEYQARLLRFSDGNTSYHYNKELENRRFQVRPVRDFSR